MNQWRKSIASWVIGPELFLSVPFTWLLPAAWKMAEAHGKKGMVWAGGPAVALMPEYLADVAACLTSCEGLIPGFSPLAMHNPLATFTTRGCPNHCPFCAVPRLEGEFRELEDWPVRPVVCDNNLLAASKAHFNRVIDSLKCLPFVDFNQGLEAGRFTFWHLDRIRELRRVKIRFSMDSMAEAGVVVDAVDKCLEAGIPKRNIGVYVLIGFNDSPQDARERLEIVRNWGIRPNPMRFQPLDSLDKNAYVAPGWTDFELRRMMKYYSQLRYLDRVPFEDFRPDDLPLLGGTDSIDLMDGE